MAVDIPGLGTALQVYITSTSSYTTIAQVSNIEWGGLDNGQRNPTTLDSAFVEKKPTITDCGEVSFELAFDPNDSIHRLIHTSCVNKTSTLDWKLIFADGMSTPSNITFKGYVQTFELNGIEVDETVLSAVTVPVTSIVSFAAGSSA